MTLSELIVTSTKLPSIVKKKHGKSPEISAVLLVDAILNTDSLPDAAILLGVGEQTLNRVIAKELVPIFGKLSGGNRTWKYVLLKAVSYKQCHVCNKVKPYSKFGLDKYTDDGRFRKCRACRSYDNASLYEQRKLRIPSWHDIEKEQISEFYDNCPEGYHVDHIIPLQGEHVSGLHTLNNLQYLPASENIRKGNKFICPDGETGKLS